MILINKKRGGFTLIEAMVVVFIVVVTAVTFYSVFTLGVKHIVDSKNRLGATALANEKMEIIKNLDYENIGTKKEVSPGSYVYGIPVGDILEEETIIRNNREYYVHTLVQYVDDLYDGMEDGSPDDDIPTDYKRVRIEVAWSPEAETNKSISLTGTFIPSGIEKAEEGGTLSVNVINNEGLGIPQALVHIYNSDAGIDINTSTDDTGNIIFPGAPAGEQNYALEISKSGYYSMQTYAPYPTSYFYPSDVHASVVEGRLNVKSIMTDKISDLTLKAKDLFGNSIASLGFDIKGGKKLGDTATDPSESIYVLDQTTSFDANGEKSFSSLSFGVYFFNPQSSDDYYFMKLDNDQMEANQIDLPPDNNLEVGAIYADKNINSVLVQLIDEDSGWLVSDATVKLKKDDIGFSTELVSDKYGQAFFPTSLPELESGEYQLTVEMAGYKSVSKTINVDKFVIEETKMIEE